MARALRIRNWEKHYENNRSRELRRPEWLPLPNKFDGSGFMELLDHAAGMSHYGAWCLLLGVASRMPTRGLFVADSGRPLAIKDIARMTRGSVKAFEEAIPRLIEVRWMEEVDTESLPWGKEDAAAGCDEGAGIPHDAAEIPQGGAGLVRLKGKGNMNGKGKLELGSAAPPPWGLSELIARHPKVYVGKGEDGRWQAVLDEFGQAPIEDGCQAIAKTLRQGQRILLSVLTGWLGDNYARKESNG